MCFEKKEKAKIILLKLLDTDEIQRKIRSIVTENKDPQNEGMDDSIGSASLTPDQEFQRQLIELRTEKDTLEKCYQQLQAETERIRKESAGKDDKIRELSKALRKEKEDNSETIQRLESCEKIRISLEEKVKKIEKAHLEYQAIFDLYLSLPNPLRKSLKGIFNESDLWAFIISGTQPNSLMEFWDFCKRDLNRGKLLDEREKLVKIFDFFLQKINRTLYEEPFYLYQEVEKGSAFDTAQHIAVSDGAACGRIQEVLFPGIIYASSKKILKKSLVMVD